jgi:hypothetical protein
VTKIAHPLTLAKKQPVWLILSSPKSRLLLSRLSSMVEGLMHLLLSSQNPNLSSLSPSWQTQVRRQQRNSLWIQVPHRDPKWLDPVEDVVVPRRTLSALLFGDCFCFWCWFPSGFAAETE